VTLITPNLPEMARFLGVPAAIDVLQMQAQVWALYRQYGIDHVLLKGGHLENSFALYDVLLSNDKISVFAHDCLVTPNSHGTGCTLSSAIATHLAFGLPMVASVWHGIDYLQAALLGAKNWRIGQGNGPLQHAVLLGKHEAI
jgi:hydroxymethylpyrimidine/phosphomethylpyrimidine kinase